MTKFTPKKLDLTRLNIAIEYTEWLYITSITLP